MKQMRSRFRLITLLLVCGFLLTLAVCTGTALKKAGISLSVSPFNSTASPAPSVSPSSSPAQSLSPGLSETPAGATVSPVTDIFTNQEYNTTGL